MTSISLRGPAARFLLLAACSLGAWQTPTAALAAGAAGVAARADLDHHRQRADVILVSVRNDNRVGRVVSNEAEVGEGGVTIQ